MKKTRLQYVGYSNKKYCFKCPEDTMMKFDRIRAELISEFDLTNDTSVSHQFEISYFVANDGDTQTYIISDLVRL